MIKNSQKLKKLEATLLRKSKFTIEEKLKLYDALWSHAVKLRKFSSKKKLEGIENDIHIARVLNSVR